MMTLYHNIHPDNGATRDVVSTSSLTQDKKIRMIKNFTNENRWQKFPCTRYHNKNDMASMGTAGPDASIHMKIPKFSILNLYISLF